MNYWEMNFYYLLIFFSVILSFSSKSWIQLWISLEMNLMFFIPIIYEKKNNFSSQSMMKYFIIQSFSSNILLMMIFLNYFLNQLSLLNFILMFSIFLKLGMPPFHFWYQQIMEMSNWTPNYFLMTFQKIIPLYILTFIKMNLMLMLVYLSIFLSLSYLFNTSSIRKMLTFSSILNLNWILLMIMNSTFYWMNFFIFYMIIMLSLLTILNKFNLFVFNQLIFIQSNLLPLLILLNFLSLAGMPPFLGFFLKLNMIFYFNLNLFVLMIILLIFSSLIITFIYLNVLYPLILKKINFNFNFFKMNYYIWLVNLSMFMILLPLI